MSEHDDLLAPTETDIGMIVPQARTVPFLFLVLEAERPLAGGARFALDDVDEVLVGRSERGGERRSERSLVERRRRLTIRTGGRYLSKEHALFRRVGQGWTLTDLDSRNGVTVNGATIDAATALNPGDLAALGRLTFVLEHDAADAAADFDSQEAAAETPGMVTLLPSLAARLTRLRREAPRATSITLVGETGTGKEVVARAIHTLSGRSGPYLAVNCGAIPRELIQSELFGHTRGAFSGANETRAGYLRDANQGTLLLDEVVAATPEVQVALLRAIQERTITPVGSTRAQPVDVRFIAAAQRPLSAAVADNQFRADLQARLEAFVFELPPLRERLADVGLLIAATLRNLGVSERDNPRLSAEAATCLLRYDWPRNIRELAQAIDVAWGGADAGEIGDADLPKPKAGDDAAGTAGARFRQQIVASLRASNGNIAEAARRLGKTRPLLYHHMRRLGIDPESFRK